jgi:hypothetical protein
LCENRNRRCEQIRVYTRSWFTHVGAAAELRAPDQRDRRRRHSRRIGAKAERGAPGDADQLERELSF